MWLTVFVLLVSLRESEEAQRRRCVYLARAHNARHMEEAGNVSGAVHHCARTLCCMGSFFLGDGHPVPDLLGCNVVEMECPETSCFSSEQDRNFTNCVCNTDFCNGNFTWVAPPSPSTASPGVSSLYILVIPLAVFLMVFCFYIITRYTQFLNTSVTKPPPDCDRMVTSQCSCHRSESPDLSLASIELHQVVGQGHFASVWRACLHGAPVVVKVFSAHYTPEFQREREVYSLPLLDHAGVVRFLGAGRGWPAGDGFLVLELAVHGSLRSFLCWTSSSWACCVKLIQSLSQGLAFLHSDLHRNGMHKPAVSHGDLSSSNVVVRADGSCALCDFGCSTILRCPDAMGWQQHRHLSQVRAQVGTLCYLPPEILEGFVNLGNSRYLMQGDVYALGLLLWEVWTRCAELSAGTSVSEYRVPYEAELGMNPSREDLVSFVSERRERPTVPEEWGQHYQGFYTIREVLEDCWDQDPEARLTAQCAADRLATLLP
ncbi:hypothetical protein AAFF_G00298360 [Aldrovandia affinis]|uniref:receptor protein serine/threonine kinase n=1 Tax=Aldrovandia affinis TaxID=143900 RepID=A0AAD7R8T7_9TELE|nr:hypothetical protein AAFF_G00298360 [Aldrovandia affinis]